MSSAPTNQNGLWVLGTVLSKHDIQAFGVSETSKQIVGYQYAASQSEAIGRFVAKTQERYPGFSLGEIISLEIPPAQPIGSNEGL